jgi:hypothetical protein
MLKSGFLVIALTAVSFSNVLAENCDQYSITTQLEKRLECLQKHITDLQRSIDDLKKSAKGTLVADEKLVIRSGDFCLSLGSANANGPCQTSQTGR